MPCHAGAGLPVCEWTERQCVAAYLGLSVHLGRPQPQSKDGEHLTAGSVGGPRKCSASTALRASKCEC